jgi:septum formation protein
MSDPLLVLASNSPRRRELLALCGWKFYVRSVEVDESRFPGEPPGEYVLRLAIAKARAFAASNQMDVIILAADTAVVDRNVILGKPRDPADAKKMLLRLRGRTHQVYTGLAALREPDGYLVTDLCVSEVPMRYYSDYEMETYIDTADPLDKAGAYAIQNPKFHPVEAFFGCYASVMGLPLCHVTRTMWKMEVTPNKDVPQECQYSLRYSCPISNAVMHGDLVG